MRRIAIVGMVILAMVALPLVVGAKSGNQPAKFAVCHIPDDGGEPHVITVSEKALAAHVGDEDTGKEGHGDLLGDQCPTEDELPPVNTAPVAVITVSSGVCSVFSGGCEIFADGSASFDDQDDPLTYAWQINGPNGFAVASDLVNPSFSGPAGDYEFVLTVSDSEFSDTATFEAAIPIVP